MPKHVIEFNLPDEEDELEAALKGEKYKFILDDLNEYIRAKSKYEGQSKIDIAELREFIANKMTEYDL